MANLARFYRDVLVAKSEGGNYSVLLDGKAVRTPTGAVFALPTVAAAEAVADEWRSQGEKVRPETMMLTKLANTAIDRVAASRSVVIEQVLAFAKNDLVCYRAAGPEELVQQQARVWEPLLDWAREHLSAPLVCTAGLAHVRQAAETLATLERAIAAHDDFSLAGLHAAATLTGSAVIALALSKDRLSAEEAFAAAELDEIYQRDKWGRDEEGLRRSRKKELELTEIAAFLKLVCAGDNSL